VKLAVPMTLVALALAGAAQAGVIYTQNFDSMGTSGTTAPAGWSEYSLPGSHDNFRFAGSLPTITTTVLPSDSPTLINNVGSGAAVLNPTLTAAVPSNQRSAGGFNFGLSGSPSDRALGTSPTGVAGCELQLSLINNTGADLSALSISYDIRRFSTTTANNSGYTGPNVGLEELPGYWLFFSLDNGSNWINVSTLNPTKTGPTGVIVPNTVGVTNVPDTGFDLGGGTWTNGGTILFRWFDDNAQSPSPDQLYGLDNVVLSTPEPAGLAFMVVGGLILRRRRAA
jgi:hypothetical protein